MLRYTDPHLSFIVRKNSVHHGPALTHLRGRGHFPQQWFSGYVVSPLPATPALPLGIVQQPLTLLHLGNASIVYYRK